MEKYSKKLVSKCIYIQILKCTDSDLLGQFMAAGGWNLVHNWLRDGEISNNWAFIQELLEMLLLCPVDGNRLKSNHTPKIVKNLSISCVHQTVKILSSKLVEQWLKIAHQEKEQLSAAQNNVDVKSTPVEDNKVNESLQNGNAEDESSNKKPSSENIKYKVNSKEGSGKLLLTLKRSTSPSVDEKDSKVSRTSSSDSSKSSSPSKSSKSDKEKEKKSSSSSSSHRSSSKSSHRSKERSSSSSSSHHKSSSSSKHSSSRSSSSKSSSSSSRDKDRKRDSHEKEKSQAEKDKETLDFLTPMPSAKLQRIPKRQHSDNSENKSAESNEASPTNKVVEKKKPSISIEVRKGEKPKTVKTLNSQFRNHGLAEEPPKPPSRKDLKKPTSTVPAPVLSSPPVVAKTSTSPPPTKKIHLEPENVPERVGGVKLIKPKRKYLEHPNRSSSVVSLQGNVSEWFISLVSKYFPSVQISNFSSRLF